MTKLLFKNLLSPLLILVTVWNAMGALATANESTTVPNSLAVEPNATEIEQTSQATEIKSGDWAYQNLQALSKKYSCANTPDGKTLSREEFATSLNSCVQSIEQLVARRKVRKLKKRRSPAPAVTTPPPVEQEVIPPAPEPTPVAPPAPVEPEVTQQDLDRVKALVQSFSTELQAVDSRIRELDDKVTKVKDQSFSTTTKLVGEAIFAINGLAGGPSTATRNTIFADRVRLNFRSSFTGKDLLLVRLQSRNSNTFAGTPSGTNMTRLGFEGSEENATYVSRLQYQLPLSATSKVYIESVGNEFNDNYYNFNPELQAAGTGSITRFGRFNPVYRLSNEGAGIGIDTKLSPNLGLVLSYAVPRVPQTGVNPAPETVNNPSQNNGLFNGSNVLFSQLTLKPSEDVSLGLIYARTYTTNGTVLSGNTGSTFANNPFAGSPTSGNHYSVLGSVNLSKNLVLSAWGGLTQANREATGGGSADIWNYAATLAVKDFGSKGSTLGFVVGMQPKVTSNTTVTRRDNDTSLHLETFYKYKVSDNLYITPGLLLLTNPEHNAGNPTEYLGTIRTTFVF
ncbi:iron uptake porin [Chamaesiphon sp. VAR_69_metabat_338]|uniref:iron uptake porin n=1 Tax=Chamaesiphon sp. VAR_69_metabat_338 TaxID=2964704 RepID=UPI00286EA8AD|nr:iron uptake porin [Chamaesiphon sp. VAR_69_metabat_338]